MTVPVETSTESPWPPVPAYELSDELPALAAEAIAPYLADTPLVHSQPLTEVRGRPVFLKCENQQVTGSFKVRGALARLTRLHGQERHRGVVAASAGNHALGVAWACRQLGIPGLCVVPETISPKKLRALQAMTVKVRVLGRCYDETEAQARAIAAEAEATFISPFDDPWVIAGNGGTVALEVLRGLPEVGLVVAPVGGGGLASGLGLVLHRAGVPLVGVNSAACPAMARTLADRHVHLTFEAAPTLAEGLEGGVSPSTAAFCARWLERVEVVSEEAIRDAIRFMARRHGLVLEGSAAVAVALLQGGAPLPGRGPIGVILTGRNLHSDILRNILTEHT